MPRPRSVVSNTESIFAANIAGARAARNWTLARLSVETGGVVKPTAIWKSERDGRRVTVGEAVALCAALDLDLHAATSRPLTFRVQVEYAEEET